MKIKNWVTTTILSSSLLLAACGSTDGAETKVGNDNQEVLKVYTTIYPLEDFAKKIGGEYVEVKSIYPPNVDAHSFEPSTKDMVSLAESDLFVYTGVGVEGFADKAVEALKNEDLTILAAGEGLTLLKTEEEEHAHEHGEEHMHDEEAHDEHAEDHAHNEEAHDEHTEEHAHEDEAHDEQAEEHAHEDEAHDEHAEDHEHEDEAHDEHNHDHGGVDPHVWLDPILSIELAENIKNSLSELMPEHANEFEENFTTLTAELEKLDQEFKTTIEQSKTKYLLVAHAAYGYWEARYGIEQIAISGISPTLEPSQKALKTIIEESQEHQISHVVFDQNLTSKVSEVIQKEIGAEALTLHNLESVTEENIENNEDYFSIMRANLKTLETALNN